MTKFWVNLRTGPPRSISLWTRTLSLLFSSNLTFLLLSKGWLDMKAKKFQKTRSPSIFQRSFHWRRRCRIVSNDADSNETVKKTIDLISKTTTLQVHNTFLYISCPFLHDYDVKMHNFAFYGGRKQATTNLFLFLSLNMVPWNSA